jgi:hypothetical protein
MVSDRQSHSKRYARLKNRVFPRAIRPSVKGGASLTDITSDILAALRIFESMFPAEVPPRPGGE